MIAGILAAFDISSTEDDPPEESYMSGIVSYVAAACTNRIIADGVNRRYVKPFRCHIRPRSEASASLVQMTMTGE